MFNTYQRRQRQRNASLPPPPSPSPLPPSRPPSAPVAPPNLTTVMSSLEDILETLKGSQLTRNKEERRHPEERHSEKPKDFDDKPHQEDISGELQKIKLPKFSGGRAGEHAEAWLEGMIRCFALREYFSTSKTKIIVFQLKGNALIWWGNLEKQLHITSDIVPWELFVD